MKTLFILPGPPKWASSRFRAIWPAKYMQDATYHEPDKYQKTSVIESFEAYIWIKIGNPEMMQRLVDLGKQVWWDVCDPAWWFSPQDARQIADAATGVVASNHALAQDFREWYGDDSKPIKVIPDRLDFEHYDRARPGIPLLEKPRLIWFGAAQNRIALFSALANLDRLHANGYEFTLTIFDDQPDNRWFGGSYPVYYSEWKLETEVSVLTGHDIALLPPYPGPWGRVKSDNKAITAKVCGLPVWDGQDYEMGVKMLANYEAYCQEVENEQRQLASLYDVRRSASEWEALLEAKP